MIESGINYTHAPEWAQEGVSRKDTWGRKDSHREGRGLDVTRARATGVSCKPASGESMHLVSLTLVLAGTSCCHCFYPTPFPSELDPLHTCRVGEMCKSFSYLGKTCTPALNSLMGSSCRGVAVVYEVF